MIDCTAKGMRKIDEQVDHGLHKSNDDSNHRVVCVMQRSINQVDMSGERQGCKTDMLNGWGKKLKISSSELELKSHRWTS